MRASALLLALAACGAQYVPGVPNDSVEVVEWHGHRMGARSGAVAGYAKRVTIKKPVVIQGVPCQVGSEARFDRNARLLDAVVGEPVDFDQLHCEPGYVLRRRYDDDGGHVTRCREPKDAPTESEFERDRE